jgi:uncharacterized membrane protein HdeD (DUF308 family)
MLKNSPWWLTLIQGLVALGIGLFMLLDPGSASTLAVLLASIYLLVAGLMHTLRGLAARRAGKGTLLLIRGVAGLVIGAVILLFGLFEIGSPETVRTILAIGLIVFGAIGLFTSLLKREGKPFAWGPVLVNVALLAWGLLIILSNLNLTTVSGWILVIIGVVVIGWTILGRKDPVSDAA